MLCAADGMSDTRDWAQAHLQYASQFLYGRYLASILSQQKTPAQCIARCCRAWYQEAGRVTCSRVYQHTVLAFILLLEVF